MRGRLPPARRFGWARFRRAAQSGRWNPPGTARCLPRLRRKAGDSAPPKTVLPAQHWLEDMLQFGQGGVAPHQHAPADLRADDAQPTTPELAAGGPAARRPAPPAGFSLQRGVPTGRKITLSPQGSGNRRTLSHVFACQCVLKKKCSCVAFHCTNVAFFVGTYLSRTKAFSFVPNFIPVAVAGGLDLLPKSPIGAVRWHAGIVFQLSFSGGGSYQPR